MAGAALLWFASCALALDFPFAQAQVSFQKIGNAEHIPEHNVTVLLVDPKGWLWIGSQHGLIRYDGYRFRRFTHEMHNPASLAGNHVSALWLAPDGRLWVGSSSDGVSIFDPASERFTRLQHRANQPGLPGNQINALTGDAAGHVWIGSEQGLSLYSPEQQSLRNWGVADGLLDQRVRSLALDKHGRLWLGSPGGLQRFDGRHWRAFDSQAGQALHGQSVTALLPAADGKLWIGTQRRGLFWLEEGELPLRQAQRDSTPHGSVRQLLEGASQQIWVAWNGDGVQRLHAADASVLDHWRHDPAQLNSLGHNDVTSMAQDGAGLIWVGSIGGGLQRLQSQNQAIRLLQHNPNQRNSISASSIGSILAHRDGRLWLAVAGFGIEVLDRSLGVVDAHRPPLPGQTTPGLLPEARIGSLTQAPDGAVWAGTRNHGLARLAPNSRHWQLFGRAHGLPDENIMCMLHGKNGDFFVGTRAGLARWDASSQRFVALKRQGGAPMQQQIHALAQDASGRLFAASHVGLWMLAPGAAGLDLYAHEDNRPSSLISNRVNGLLLDSKGQLWVDTALGLERLQRLEGLHAEFAHISEQMGRPGRSVGENLLEDSKGLLWTEGLVLDPATLRWYELSAADGMQLEGSWFASYAKTQDGLLLFGGAQGMAIIDPARFTPWRYEPPLQITELRLGGTPQQPGLMHPVLQVKPEQRSFGVEFAAFDYSKPEHIRYAYRLLGYDQEWIYTDASQRYVSYTNLWPGEYRLQVRATNRLGAWSRNTLEIPVLIMPAYWQTGWFLALALCSLSLLLYGGYRWRLQHTRIEARRLQAMLDGRTADMLQLEKIGQELTATLDMEQAFARIHTQIGRRLDAHAFRIGLFNAAEQRIDFVYDIEDGQRLPPCSTPLAQAGRPAVWCVLQQRELWVNHASELGQYLDQVLPPQVGAHTETLVYLPLMQEQQVLGCLSVQSLRAQAYSETQMEFLRVLASYLAIAIGNAQAHGALRQAHEELQVAQSRLIRSEKMAAQANLLASIAHEVNTPLGTTLMALSGLQERLQASHAQLAHSTPPQTDLAREQLESLEYVQLAQQGAGRAAQLVRTFQSVAIRSEKPAPPSRLQLAAYLQDAAQLVQAQLAAQHCILEVRCEQQLHVTVCEPALTEALTRILENCVHHAFSAGAPMPAGQLGHVLLEAVEIMDGARRRVRIGVSDNGCGIAPDLLPRIFEPFTSGSGRLGLGLHVAYNQVTHYLHGEIGAQNLAQGGALLWLSVAAD
ncbi:two-component regulator propeller domain-containing protein [Massilia sp. W12]|uniref:two-component regulator propeller domain-containing protein n=1 Tax=Massilia sp. W12 TaxID=3126507 RepID=UPI0030D23497